MPSSRTPWNGWQAQKYRNMSPTPSTLNRRVDVVKKVQTTNEIGQTTYSDTLPDGSPNIVGTVWAQIIPQTGSMVWQQTETILSNVTHKVVMRYQAAKKLQIAVGDYLLFKRRRFEIQFVLDPYESNWMVELFCEEVQDT